MITLIWPNHVGVLAATIVSFVIGVVWYAPPVLGKMWMASLGKTDEWARKNRNKAVAFGFLANFLTAYLLGVFVKSLGSANWADGVEVAFLAWLAFPASVHFTSYIFEGGARQAHRDRLGSFSHHLRGHGYLGVTRTASHPFSFADSSTGL